MEFINSLVRGIKRRREISRRKSDLEGKMTRTWSGIMPLVFGYSKYDHRYFTETVTSDDKLYKNIGSKTPEQAREKLRSWYDRMPHAPRIWKDGGFEYAEDGKSIDELSPRQMYKLLVLKRNLDRQDFVNHVGELIEADFTDSYSEHGGVVVFDKSGNLVLHPIESKLAKEKQRHNNETYKPSSKQGFFKVYPDVFRYHFHACNGYDEFFAGPSDGDLDCSGVTASLDGESHDLVFTRLGKNRFNVDYYGSEKKTKI